jgi:hypothetical protein
VTNLATSANVSMWPTPSGQLLVSDKPRKYTIEIIVVIKTISIHGVYDNNEMHHRIIDFTNSMIYILINPITLSKCHEKSIYNQSVNDGKPMIQRHSVRGD